MLLIFQTQPNPDYPQHNLWKLVDGKWKIIADMVSGKSLEKAFL